MTIPNFERDLDRRVAEIEDLVKRTNARDIGSGALFQITPDGIPYFPGGIEIGGGSHTKLYEPYNIPAPSGLGLTIGSSFDTIYLDATWSPPTGLGSDQIASYYVQVVKTGDPVPMELTLASTETRTRIQPLEPVTEYTVRVAAVSRQGRNSTTIEATVMTGRDSTVPGVVTFPAGAINAGVGSLSIRWNPNVERDVANGAGQYRVRISTLANLNSPVYDVKVNGTVLFVTGLAGGTDYYVGVSAVDSSGNEGPTGTPSGGPWRPSLLTTEDIALTVGGGNLVRDSSFESGVLTTSWVPGTGPADIDPNGGRAVFGMRALRMTGTGDSSAHQDLTLAAGDWYISTWAKAASVARSAGSAALGVVLVVETLSGTVTGQTPADGGTGESPGNYVFGRGTFGWRRGSVRISVTSPTASVRVRLVRGLGGSCTGTAHFDDVQAEEGGLTAYAPRADEILPGTITTTTIANDAITTPKLAAGSVVAGKIAANSIGAVEIIARSITAAEIATDTITSNEIAAGTITASELAVGSVTAAQIAANSITTAKLAANSITAEKLAVTTSLTVGQSIQSANFVAGSTGWRVGGDGNSEFLNSTIRGSQFVAGTINIAGRIVASPADPAVHLSANCEIGGNYSGTLYSGDLNWGLQVGTFAGVRWTHVQYAGGTNRVAGFWDAARGRRTLWIDGFNNTVWHGGPDGAFIAERRNQGLGGWSTAALIVQNGGVEPNSNGNEAALTLHVPEVGVAAMWKVVGSLGSAIEARASDNSGFVPVKASAFLVNSDIRAKADVEDLDDAEAVMALRPIRFRRPTTTVCSYCNGTGKVANEVTDPDDAAADADAEDHPERRPKVLKPGSRCPVCKGKKGNPNRTEETKRNEDTPFLGLAAQEVAEAVPELAVYGLDGQADGIDYAGVTALLIRHVQRLTQEVRELQGVQ